jgi:hypothetical protein
MFPDHTGLLESGEAYVALGDACLEVGRLGEIIAIRSPSYFSSDIRKLKVVSKKELTRRCEARGKFFADINVGLVLSTQGSISEAELMSGGDFDGDKGKSSTGTDRGYKRMTYFSLFVLSLVLLEP